MTKMLKELRTGFILNKARSYVSFPAGVEMMSNMLSIIPERIPTVSPQSKPSVNTNIIKPAMPGSEGGNNLMAKNLEELRKENPELATTVEAEIRAAAKQNPAGTAADAEKKRLQEIDVIAPAVNNPALVQEAKYGEKACSAQELAYRAICLNKDIDKGVEAAKSAYSKKP